MYPLDSFRFFFWALSKGILEVKKEKPCQANILGSNHRLTTLEHLIRLSKIDSSLRQWTWFHLVLTWVPKISQIILANGWLRPKPSSEVVPKRFIWCCDQDFWFRNRSCFSKLKDFFYPNGRRYPFQMVSLLYILMLIVIFYTISLIRFVYHRSSPSDVKNTET